MYVKRNIEARSCNHCWGGKRDEYYILWVCVCSLRCPGRNAHAPYFHMWAAQLYYVFPHYLINCTIFEESYWTQNMCLNFLYTFCLKHFSF